MEIGAAAFRKREPPRLKNAAAERLVSLCMVTDEQSEDGERQRKSS